MSVRLSVRKLSWNWLFFSRAQHGVRGQCGVVHDRAGFFENNIFTPRNGKIGQA